MDYVIPVAALITWGIFCVWGGANVRAYRRVLSFRPVEATVTSTSEHVEVWDDDHGTSRSTSYHFGYSYEIDGETYTGSSSNAFIGSDSAFNKGELAEGDTVTVFVDPESPSISYSSRRGLWGGVFLFLFGQLFLWMAIDKLPG